MNKKKKKMILAMIVSLEINFHLNIIYKFKIQTICSYYALLAYFHP